MTDITQLIERLRARAEIETSVPLLIKKDSICWQAADQIEAQASEIAELREALKPFRLKDIDIESADDIYVTYRGKDGKKILVPSVQIEDFRVARAKLEGSGA